MLSSEYDEARSVYQGPARDHGPALIAGCLDEDYVVLAIGHARKIGVRIAVRGGGHGSDGYAMPAGAFVLDLSKMREVTVDPKTGIVTAQPGVLLGELDQATQEHGLVVPAGTVSTTGVAGLTLGGGIGHLMRRFGATVDNVVGFDVVTVDGRRVHADADTNPDLFWALRGGGGNFGVVTRFEYQGHPFGPEVFSGQVIFPLDQTLSILTSLPSLLADAPRELGILAAIAPAPASPDIAEAPHGLPVLILVPMWSGSVDAAADIVGPLIRLGQPLLETLRPMPWVEANRMLEAVAPYGRRMNLRGGYLANLSTGPVQTLIEHAARAATISGAMTTVNLWLLGGAISEDTPEDAVAFSRESASWLWETVHMWRDADQDGELQRAAVSVSAGMAPYSLANGYSNLTDDLGPEWRRGLHGNPVKQARLRAVKKAWDPDNLLRYNKNIDPTEGVLL